MRAKRHSTINQTFSLPVKVTEELRAYVKRREMSQFVAEAIRKELEVKKEELRVAYMQSEEDEGQTEAMEEWKETLADGAEEW